MRIAVVNLNPVDHDTRTRLICDTFIDAGYQLDIIVPRGGKITEFRGAKLHTIPFSVKPVRQRKLIEFNLRAKQVLAEIRCDLIYAVDLDTLWAAVMASKINNAKILFESREYFPGQLSVEPRLPVRIFWNIVQNQLVPKAHGVLTVNDSIAGLLEHKYGIRKPAVVMNVPDIKTSIEPIDLRSRFNITSKYIAVFQGVLRPGQGIKRAIEAVEPIDDLSLLIIGDGPERAAIENYVQSRNLSNRVKFAGMAPSDELLNYTAGADIGFLLIEPLALNSFLALPQKLFQYIAVGVAPIVTALPELKKLVLTEHVGLVLDKNNTGGDSEQLSKFISGSLAECREACRKAAAKYKWEIESKKLIDIASKLVND